MAKDRDYYNTRRKDRRKQFLALLGGRCSNCGRKKDLHFDHKHPDTKEAPIANMIDTNEARIHKEIKKCQLLCSDCHHEKTRENGEHAYPPARHGTLWMYKDKKCRCDKCREAMSEYYYSKKN